MIGDPVICHFGKHKGKPLADMPSGYLRWAVENVDPTPNDSSLNPDQIRAATETMRDFLSAAEDELQAREDREQN